MATSQVQHLFTSIAEVAVTSQEKNVTLKCIGNLHSAKQLEEVHSVLETVTQQFCGDLMSPIFPEFDNILKSVAEAYKLSFSKVNEDSASPFDRLISLGNLLALAGMLQAFLLAPQGPVDPVQKVAVKLEYAKQEVRLCGPSQAVLIFIGLLQIIMVGFT